jgi:tetratricopeptide (TPR) repeat protein/tRNA A-37 threonylcarbamoyl transferase component Bud32
MQYLTPEEARRLGEKLIWGPEEAASEEVGLDGLGAGVFGRYHLVRLIGLGGMGVVYEAEQEAPKRRVAIKVIRPELMSAETARRFEHEARILGRLQHPGIAQIYEAGRVDSGAGGGACGTPYFAMEFVEGVPLTEFARAGRLGVRERLELFLRACEAVEHAHRMGVIHRDIKPGNILVDAEGRARILDFGVARATDADVRAATMHTEAGRLLGTLPYMSPEQVAGDADGLDTRSDVYSLGVVLYELLAERPPYEVKRGPVHEAARVITETEPTPLSTVSRVYRGDLETIVGKALAKERERRYQSVGELAADVLRYLNDEPIVARRAGRWYQWQKFAQRHRAVVSALCAIGATLVVASVASSWWAYRAMSAKRAAAESAATSQVVVKFLSDLLEKPRPEHALGEPLTVASALHQAADSLAGLDVRPHERIVIERIIADSLFAVGEEDAALLHAEGVLQRCEEQMGPLNYETGVSLRSLARILASRDPERAAGLAERASQVFNDTVGPNAREALAVENLRASTAANLGDLQSSEQMFRDSLEKQRAAFGDDDPDTVDSLSNLAVVIGRQGRIDEALPLLKEVYSREERVSGETHPDTINSMANYAMALTSAKRPAEAEPIQKHAVQLARQVFGPEHPQTLLELGNYAGILNDLERYADAEGIDREVLAARSAKLGESHPDTLLTMKNLGADLCNQHRYEEAEPLLRRAIEMYVKALPNRKAPPNWRGTYGDCLAHLGRFEEAESFLIGAYSDAVDSIGRDHPRAVLIRKKVLNLYVAWGRPEKAAAFDSDQPGANSGAGEPQGR